ncbi:MAG: GC-type dockerin domain-anchored protein [Phycisphaerales bacterium JB064]
MKKFAIASLLAVPAMALAQSTPVGPFTGDLQEGFDALPGGFPASHPVFDGTAEMISLGGSMHTTTGWTFRCSIFPFEGSRLAASASGPVRFEFTDTVGQFGGYFGTNAELAGFEATVRFYDAAGNLVGDDTFTVPADCGWDWAGWQFDAEVAAIEVESPVFGGAYIQMDAMELTYGDVAGCYADFDMSGALDLFDFLAFQNAFDSGDLAADCDEDGSLTLFDFLCFQNAFDAGCE